jgi:hypothetical protein
MWGNKLGWGISAGIAVVMIGLMVLLQWSGTAPSDMTPKFAADPRNLAPLVLDPAPESIVAMDDACDAGDKYAIAIANYDPKIYDKVNPLNLDEMPALEALVEGTHCKNMTLFTRQAGKVINFEREKTPIETLRKLGEASASKALMLKAKSDKAGSQKYAEAAFALGAHMYKERVVFEEYDGGMGVMGAGTQVLLALATEAGDTARAAQLKAFNDARIKFGQNGGRVADLRAITKTIDGNISAARAGDVFALAQKSKERMWRVEACLQLARTKRFVGEEGRGADQRYAQMVLRKLADTDPDPIVKIAATRARDITDEEYFKQ